MAGEGHYRVKYLMETTQGIYDALVENFKVQFEAFNADKLDKPLTDKELSLIHI